MSSMAKESVGAKLSEKRVLEGQAPLILDIKQLRTHFHTDDGIVKAVDGVDFSVKRGKTLGVVGESGCGKSVTALSVLRLVPEPPAKISGQLLFHRNDSVIDLASLDPRGPKIRSIRGKEISMIFQEPMTSLNPVYTIGNQICETIMLHQDLAPKDARDRAIEMLSQVGIPSPERRVDEYPHQLSGGMRQRVMIAMALSCNPALLVADEPTTALDVTIQAQILDLMQELQDKFGTSIMMITHDLGVIAEVADDVIVMYLGQVVERCSTKELFNNYYHPYTEGLLKSIPKFESIREKRLQPIRGSVPEGTKIPVGCRFQSRCERTSDKCQEGAPPLCEPSPGHLVRCWRYA